MLKWLIMGLLSFSGLCLETPSENLARLTNEYRISQNKQPIKYSQLMFDVSDYHVKDLYYNKPYSIYCNIHSWSGSRPDLYEGCCYTPTNNSGPCMWYKPSQISKNQYPGFGAEVAYSTAIFS